MHYNYPLRHLFLLATGIFLSSSTLSAQDAPKEKKFFVGSSFGFFSQETESFTFDGTGNPNGVSTFKSSQIRIAPLFGWYLKPNLAIGIEGTYTRSKTNDDVSSPFWGISPFVRYLVPLWKSRFAIYNDAILRTNFSRSFGNVDNRQYESKTQRYGLAYRPGLQFRLVERFNLLASLGDLFGYSYFTETRSEKRFGQNTPDLKATHHDLSISKSFDFDNLQIGVNFLF